MDANATIESAPILLREDGEGIARLTLNRPQSRNALSDAMIAALSSELDRIASDASIKVVILEGSGPAFCAGHDMKEMSARRADPDKGAAYFLDLMQRCSAMMQKIVRLPQPVIACVEGIATAAGCQIVASCDLAVAGSASQFSTPGVNIGLFCSTPMVALSRNIGTKQAMEMLLLGEMIPATEAFRLGLVNRLAQPGEAMEQALAMARIIASKSSVTLKIGKRAFYEQREMGLGEAYDYASRVMAENMMARDAEEGIAAFIEKRTPRWQG